MWKMIIWHTPSVFVFLLNFIFFFSSIVKSAKYKRCRWHHHFFILLYNFPIFCPNFYFCLSFFVAISSRSYLKISTKYCSDLQYFFFLLFENIFLIRWSRCFQDYLTLKIILKIIFRPCQNHSHSHLWKMQQVWWQ